MKIVLWIVVAVVVLVIAAAVIGVLAADALAKAGVERGSSYALGVEARTEGVGLSLFRGRVTMDGFEASNPANFDDTTHFMTIGRFDAEVRPMSLLSDTIELRNFEIDGVDINVEQQVTGSNVSKIIANIKRLGGDEKPADEAPGRKVRVDRVRVSNVVAHFRLGGAGLGELGGGESVTVRLPTIELTDVATGDGGGVPVAELVGRIVPAILKAVLDKARTSGKLPGGVDFGFSDRLGGLEMPTFEWGSAKPRRGD